MDKIIKGQPAEPEILRDVLNSIDKALEGLARCCDLNHGIGPKLSNSGEVLAELLKDGAYKAAFEKCKNGEVKISGGFIPDIYVKTIDKEELIKKYLKEVKR